MAGKVLALVIAIATIGLFVRDDVLSHYRVAYDPLVRIGVVYNWAYMALCVGGVIAGSVYGQKGDRVAPFVGAFCVLMFLVVAFASLLPSGMVR